MSQNYQDIKTFINFTFLKIKHDITIKSYISCLEQQLHGLVDIWIWNIISTTGNFEEHILGKRILVRIIKNRSHFFCNEGWEGWKFSSKISHRINHFWIFGRTCI